MLKNIKSIYIIKITISYLSELHKLNLIKYNKTFQKKLNVSIMNYIVSKEIISYMENSEL